MRIIMLTILFVIPLIGFASFPINQSFSSEISNSISINAEDNKDEENGVKWGLLISVLLGLGFSAYFLIKSWWRAWKDEIKWVRILTYIVFGFLSLLLAIIIFFNSVGVYNPGG
jgi:hypothetical protein